MWINTHVDKSLYTRCFVPLYEDVVRRGGIGHILIRRMFDGYLFLETDEPEKVDTAIKKMPGYTTVLAADDEKGKLFLPIYKEEELFLDSILTDGIMHCSYVRYSKEHKIEQAIGPLEKYLDRIIKVDLHHRRAVVQIPLFGEERQIKFGLWLDADPKLERIEEEKNVRRKAATGKESPFKAGDMVINTRGLFGDTPMMIKAVDQARNCVTVCITIFGRDTDMEMSVDNLEIRG